MAEMQLRLTIAMLVWKFRFESTPKHLSDFKAEDALTHRPQQCFIRLTDPRRNIA